MPNVPTHLLKHVPQPPSQESQQALAQQQARQQNQHYQQAAAAVGCGVTLRVVLVFTLQHECLSS